MFDALTMAAIVDELYTALAGGRIQQVVHVDPLTLALEVYAQQRRRWLIVSADPQHARLLLVDNRVTGDAEKVTPVLLLLRKYARGGRIVAVSQPRYERIIRLSIAKPLWGDKTEDDAAGDDEEDEDDIELVYSELIVELMGRRSNVIYADEQGRIHDAVKRVTAAMSRARTVLPGQRYVLPPAQDKLEPRGVPLLKLAELAQQSEQGLEKWLIATFVGVSPLIAREVAFRAGLDPAVAVNTLPVHQVAPVSRALEAVFLPLVTSDWEPAVYTLESGRTHFAPVRLESLAALQGTVVTPCASILEAAQLASEQDAGDSATPGRHAARRERLVAEIEDLRDKVAHRLASLRDQRAQAEAAETWRLAGETIYARLHELTPGLSEVEGFDGATIKLDPTLSPSENAQHYFERYRKAQSAAANVPELIARAEQELAYLDQLRTLARLADSYDEIESMRLEWLAYTAASGQSSRASRPKGARPAAGARKPRSYRTAGGDTILIGRTGPQNDAVTFDIAGPSDLWLHARNMPGAHVILRSSGATAEATVEQAAALAAYYSDGRDATSVPVDVTERRHVRKIKGAGPGLVTYRNERTVNVRPRSEKELGFSNGH